MAWMLQGCFIFPIIKQFNGHFPISIYGVARGKLHEINDSLEVSFVPTWTYYSKGHTSHTMEFKDKIWLQIHKAKQKVKIFTTYD
jgi:hypothetical protein